MPTRVLSVLSDYPLPATTGLHLRMLSNLDLIRRLGCESRVLYFSTEERPDLSVGADHLQMLCDGISHGGKRKPQDDFSHLSLLSHKIDFLVRGALGIPGRHYPFSMRYDAIGAEGRILAEAKQMRAEYVVLPCHFVHYAKRIARSGHKVIMDAIDVLSELTGILLKRYGQESRAKRLGLYANHLACRTQESLFMRHCCEIWATSPAEARVLSQIAPGVNVLSVPSSIDEEEVKPRKGHSQELVGFIGTYSVRPNLEAALFLARDVFPSVVAQRPTARLQLAGAGVSPQDLKRLRGMPYVEVCGPVTDSHQFLSDCAVVALPVFVRGGIPLKLIEAMALGCAVVVSPEMVSGLPVTDQGDCLIRNDAAGFASAVIQLLESVADRKRLGAEARETFLRNWSRARALEVVRKKSILSHTFSSSSVAWSGLEQGNARLSP